MRGGWIGASLSTTRPALVRAAMEGICFEMRQSLEQSGRRFAAIRLIGGAACSDFWNQMQADVYGCPVETIAAREAGALGAAMIAAWGAGLYPGLEDAARGMVRLKRRYEPDPDKAGRFSESYRAWLNCTEALSDGAFWALSKVRRRGIGC